MSNPNTLSLAPSPANPNQDPTQVLDPAILQLAQDPLNNQQMPDAERTRALAHVKKLAALDARNRQKIVKGSDGKPYWAAEYPTVFAFDGQLRGSFDRLPRDPSKLTPEQQIGLMTGVEAAGGRFTDVVVETDMGEQVLIRKTSEDAISSSKQTFDVMSTTIAEEAGRQGQKPTPRSLDTSMLADVVLVPGMPMQLGRDPTTGTMPRTRGNITKITAFRMNEAGEVHPDNHRLKMPESHIDTRERFNRSIRAAHAAGEAAMTSTVQVAA